MNVWIVSHIIRNYLTIFLLCNVNCSLRANRALFVQNKWSLERTNNRWWHTFLFIEFLNHFLHISLFCYPWMMSIHQIRYIIDLWNTFSRLDIYNSSIITRRTFSIFHIKNLSWNLAVDALAVTNKWRINRTFCSIRIWIYFINVIINELIIGPVP